MKILKTVLTDNDLKICKADNIKDYLPLIDGSETDAETYSAFLENDYSAHLLFYKNEAVGAVVYEMEDDRGFLSVYIFPEYRRKGIGGSVVRSVEERFARKKVKKFVTAYKSDKLSAKDFAEKCGFKEEFSSAQMVYGGEKFDIPELPIRRYEDKDFSEAFTLSDEAFHSMRLGTGLFPNSHLSKPNEKIRRSWSKDADCEYVYTLNNEIIGYAKVDGSIIDSVSVKISHQGKGLGRNFVKYLTNVIIEKEGGAPRLWCVVGNGNARRLYDSLGYKERERVTFLYKDIPAAK